jgi:hypothetical protein
MSEALVAAGITQDEYNTIVKIREPLKKGNSCEIKRTKDGGMKVYEVKKEVK